MLSNHLKRLAAGLPLEWQHRVKRAHFRMQIRRGRFTTPEPDYLALPRFVTPGDWVVDLGANVGHYTKALSDLVGPNGRVIAFEPVPDTFALLATNVLLFRYANVTLVNAAVSDVQGLASMTIPQFDTGLRNFYEAKLDIEAPDRPSLRVMTMALDSLRLPRRLAFVKIDVEGHEMRALEGMAATLERDHPVLVVETRVPEVRDWVYAFGYTSQRLPGSPNLLFTRQSEQ